MKRIGTVRTWVAGVLACLFALSFSACEKETENKAEFTGLTFTDVSYVYDGKEKELSLQGAPDDAQVVYENNKRTAAGESTATGKENKNGADAPAIKEFIQPMHFFIQ